MGVDVGRGRDLRMTKDARDDAEFFPVLQEQCRASVPQIVEPLMGAWQRCGKARGERATGIVMNPTDYWEMAVETLGTSGAGGWAFDAATGPQSAPVINVWGIPVYRDVNLPTGTALAGNWADCDVYIGQEFRIDVSSEAGSRFDQNVTGFRGEEEFAFNAEPYVRTGKFVKILGL